MSRGARGSSKRANNVGLLLVALLLLVLFGGLGMFVTNASFAAVLVVLALALIGGGVLSQRRGTY
jgi:hypothetical protein